MTRASKYKNKDSIVLESSTVRAEFIPNPGGKMASLINKSTGHEYLLQRENRLYREQPFNGIYTEGECSGFDDMFPTIDKCTYESKPWRGVELADHGEVWSLPWEYSINDDVLHFSVKGVCFPYTLEKKVYFINENSLRLDYSLTNESPFEFEFLWAGHLMFNLEEGARIKVPGDCKQVVTVLSNRNRKFGDLNSWPLFENDKGDFYRADVCRSRNVNGFEKYYFTNRLTEGWCELLYPDTNNKLSISFPVDTVPYLGILMDECGWDNLYTVIIEPCTICYDRPDVAKRFGQVCKIAPASKYNWHLQLAI